MRVISLCIVSLFVCLSRAIPTEIKKRRSKHVKFVPEYDRTSCYPFGLCNETAAYPEEHIEKLVKKIKNKKLLQLFNESLVESLEKVPKTEFREPSLTENLCRTKRVSVLPKTAKTVDNKLRFVVNVQGLSQSLIYETCVDEGADCIDNKMFPYNFQTVCKQKYSVVRLMSVNETGKLEYGRFLVPSTCACHKVVLSEELQLLNT
ncbi:uncharacterized protein LOC132702377 [Cylas formicarius]|uniref:uncharacterized protein LOC132702377 n=1 Tax=Cylas formicarius TaxID=197179 RepID=UPI002958B256|nr:uncharacterized protein LOC132702377 [Cylas formicarius]